MRNTLVGGGGFGENLSTGQAVVFSGDNPTRSIGKQAADELGVQSVAGFVSFHSGQDWQADERQVADEIERFVAAEFVGKAQRAIHHAAIGQDDGIFQRTATDQSHGAKRLDIAFEAESSRTRQQAAKSFREHDHFNLLLADQRMGKIDVALHMKIVGRIDADAAILFDNFNRLDDLEVAATTAQAANAGLIEQLQKRLSGTIEDWDFNRVDIDKHVVDARRV